MTTVTTKPKNWATLGTKVCKSYMYLFEIAAHQTWINGFGWQKEAFPLFLVSLWSRVTAVMIRSQCRPLLCKQTRPISLKPSSKSCCQPLVISRLQSSPIQFYLAQFSSSPNFGHSLWTHSRIPLEVQTATSTHSPDSDLACTRGYVRSVLDVMETKQTEACILPVCHLGNFFIQNFLLLKFCSNESYHPMTSSRSTQLVLHALIPNAIVITNSTRKWLISLKLLSNTTKSLRLVNG